MPTYPLPLKVMELELTVEEDQPMPLPAGQEVLQEELRQMVVAEIAVEEAKGKVEWLVVEVAVK